MYIISLIKNVEYRDAGEVLKLVNI
jgi:hypothetical protein